MLIFGRSVERTRIRKKPQMSTSRNNNMTMGTTFVKTGTHFDINDNTPSHQ